MTKKQDEMKEEQMKKEQEQKAENKIEIERSGKNDNQDNTTADPETASEEAVNESNNEQDLSSEKIKDLEQQVSDLKDQLLRKVAEFENYKRRTENEQLNFMKYAGESLIKKVLPVYDDLRRSLDHADAKNGESLVKGIKMVYDKFTKTLKEEGVEKIEAKGKEFDFNLHEALMQREVDGVPAHTVIDEIEPGYMYKDKVIRHAKVIVSQESSEE